MSTTDPNTTPTPERLEELYEQCSNWGRWGDDDELGALNLLTPQRRAAAMASVRSGRSISLANDLPKVPSAENPFPAHHHMLASGDALDSNGIPGYEATRDYVGTDVHGLGVTHIDALCHMFAKGRSYNDAMPDTVKSTGATANTIMAAADGIVGRGVLLDVARALGEPHLPGNTAITPDQLDATCETQGVEVGEGDLLLVATGRDARRTESRGRFDPIADGMAGLHAECLPWLHERGIALLGGDGISDPMPGLGIAEWPFPIHQIAITRLGLMLIDNCRLDDLAAACADAGAWDFLLSVAPLRVPGGTGCPVNPIAVL
jgi:kynurenine formamidase